MGEIQYNKYEHNKAYSSALISFVKIGGGKALLFAGLQRTSVKPHGT
jgi:hypothetical protein